MKAKLFVVGLMAGMMLTPLASAQGSEIGGCDKGPAPETSQGACEVAEWLIGGDCSTDGPVCDFVNSPPGEGLPGPALPGCEVVGSLSFDFVIVWFEGNGCDGPTSVGFCLEALGDDFPLGNCRDRPGN